ncbi:MAG: PAS domain-containing protein, partial [Candidatus Scalindua sp.]|nr:PAS domain-containing protein [Candidatus Scalindua sp.]
MTGIIENRESLQEIALRHLDDGVFMFNRDRKIVLFNPACERIAGYLMEEIRENESNCFDIFKCHSSDKSCLAV